MDISKYASILINGGIIAFPTETVYGFGVIFDDEKAYEKLINIKRRPPEKPFTLMCEKTSDIEKYGYFFNTDYTKYENSLVREINSICYRWSTESTFCESTYR